MFVRAVTRSCNAFSAVRKCSTEKLEKTAFYDLHLSLGGKMVPFAGYSLPVQYEGLGVLKEHVHTRSADGASLFDVSHMGQIKWTGKDAVAFIEKMTVCDVKSLKVGEAKLSLVMNEKGTIMDDTVITNAGDHLYMVVNGACKVSIPIWCALYMFLSLQHVSNVNSGRTWTTSSTT
jgi:aminomethyltransferase